MAVAQNAAQFGTRQAEVQRYQYAAQFHAGQQQQGVFNTIFSQQSDALPRCDAALLKTGSQALGAIIEFGVAECLIAAAQGGHAGMVQRVELDHFVHVHGGSLSIIFSLS